MKSIVFTVLLALGLVAPAAAQLPTATIRGTVRDSGGAVVPGATVSVTNADTGFSRAAVSGGDGTYRLAALPVGRYEVRVELQGFRTAVRSGLTMTVGQEALLNFPRAGFAWDVKGDGKTAVRGGAAILYDIATFGAILSLNWPYSSTSRRTDRQSEQPGRSDSTWYPGRETRGAVSDRCGYATTMKIFSSMLVVFGLPPPLWTRKARYRPAMRTTAKRFT